jgi:ribosomal protein S18 acetylase RimI-like enzyme
MEKKLEIKKQKVLNVETEEIMKRFYLELQKAEYEFNNDRDLSEECNHTQIEDLKESMKEDNFELYIAFSSEVPIGFLELQDEFNAEASYKYTYVHALLISKEYQGRGYGKQLMEFAKSVAKSKGFKHIGLNVIPNNSPAVGLYKSQGFKEYGIEMMCDVE